MRYKYLGHCVIVNNVAEETPGTRQEVADLADACEAVGFDVTVHEDLTREQMEDLRRKFISEKFHEDRCYFMLCVIAHGDGWRIGARPSPIDKSCLPVWNVQTIKDDLDTVRSLSGKPKLLLIDACRGDKHNIARMVPVRSSPSLIGDMVDLISQGRDFLVFFATTFGYVSYKDGEYFQTVAEFLKKYFKTSDLQSIYRMVNYQLSKKANGKGQMISPDYTSSLIGQVHFSHYKGVQAFQDRFLFTRPANLYSAARSNFSSF